MHITSEARTRGHFQERSKLSIYCYLFNIKLGHELLQLAFPLISTHLYFPHSFHSIKGHMGTVGQAILRTRESEKQTNKQRPPIHHKNLICYFIIICIKLLFYICIYTVHVDICVCICVCVLFYCNLVDFSTCFVLF